MQQSSVTLWVVWEYEEIDAGRPSSRPEDGDPLWVSTKVADVLVEPTKSLNLVQKAVVSLSGLIAGTEEACVFGVWKKVGRIFKRKRKNDRTEREENISVYTFSI